MSLSIFKERPVGTCRLPGAAVVARLCQVGDGASTPGSGDQGQAVGGLEPSYAVSVSVSELFSTGPGSAWACKMHLLVEMI